MIYLTKEDYFEVYLGSMISSNDRDTLFMLYQPIIGHDAIALYFSLYAEFKKQDNSNISTHEDLLENMNINITALQEARRLLEGIGLLQTYYKSNDNQNFYKYRLYAPKAPSEFFKDLLFKGLLVRAVGAKKANRLANIYKSKDFNIDGFNDISESFIGAFHPDLDSNSFNTDLKSDKTYKHKTKDITKDFDRGEFLNSLENNHNILSKSIKKKDIEEISKIALLYGIEEIVAADFVSQSIDSKGKIDFEKVKQLSINDQNYAPIIMNKYKSKENYDGESLKAKKAQLMASVSAIEFLKIKQNNTAISPSDIKLVDTLANDYGLTSQVINPLIDYVLQNYDNTLPRNLVLKIGASLARNQIQTTIDAMNYLYKIKSASKNKKKIEIASEEPNDSSDDIKSLLEDIGDN